jgi:peptidoglycan hydrolase CwlO-like protein
MPDGLVRFKHRSNEIMLAAKVRAPEWASALLEEWLMAMQGIASQPRSKQHQISDLKKIRDNLRKTIEQADLSAIKDEIKTIENRLNNADDRLSGKRF